MGAVEMGTGGSYDFEGYRITAIAYCLYCDKCGSFKIGKRITLKILYWLLFPPLFAAILLVSAQMETGSYVGIVAVFCIFWYLVGISGALELGHRCKKCGNWHITILNELNYSPNDRSILDVPYEKTIRYYQDDM